MVRLPILNKISFFKLIVPPPPLNKTLLKANRHVVGGNMHAEKMAHARKKMLIHLCNNVGMQNKFKK